MTETLPPRAVSRRKLLIGAAMVGTAVVGATFVPRQTAARQTDKSFEALIPKTIGDWRYQDDAGLVLPPPDQLSDTLYEQLVTRVYRHSDGSEVMLLLAYSSTQEGRLQVHRPEICYPAAGFRIERNMVRNVAVSPSFDLPTRFIVAERNARREQLTYWTRVGPSIPTRWFDQRLTMATENLKGRIPDGILVRISTIGPSSEAAMALLDRFTRALITETGERTRRMLVGAS